MSCRILLSFAMMVVVAVDPARCDDRYTLRRYLTMGATGSSGDIRTGRALTFLGDTLIERGLRPADHRLTDYQLSLIKCQPSGGGAIFALTSGEVLAYSWPPALLRVELASLMLAVDNAADRVRADTDDHAAIAELQASISALRDQLKVVMPKEDRQASGAAWVKYWVCDRFLYDLLVECGRLSRFGSPTGHVPCTARTVCGVFDHIVDNQLAFAPATPAGDPVYVSVYEALAYPLRMDAALMAELNDLPPPNAEYLAELEARWERVRERAIERERRSRGKPNPWGWPPSWFGPLYPQPDGFGAPSGGWPYGSTPSDTPSPGAHTPFGFGY